MAQQRLELTWVNKDKALIPTEHGRYGYSWVDPRDPRYCEIRPLVLDEAVRGEQAPKDPARSYTDRAELAPQSENLLIHGESGDVLEALTRVPELAEQYVGQVKCIYIDPPFNTSQTFTHYEDNLEHSVWLTMMRDRLLHLRKLLSPEGSIWVHLDDVEVHRMRLLMDEVFGAGNFVAEMVWEKTYSPRNDSTSIPAVTDFIVVYRRSDQFTANRLPRTAEMDSRYTNPDNDPRGPWTTDNPNAPGASTHLGMIFGIQHPITGEMVYPSVGSCWRFSQAKMLEIMRGWGRYEYGPVTSTEIERQQRIAGPSVTARTNVPPLVIPNRNKHDVDRAWNVYNHNVWPLFMLTQGGFGGFRRKSYLKEMPGRTPANLLNFEDVGHTDAAKKEIGALFPAESHFSTPKPERLLERVIHIASNPGDIVLDVFAGSGTTAAVAQKMGRRWVTCELLEDTIHRFTRPRLEKVVRGEDPGGITQVAGQREAAADVVLPEGMTAEDAQRA